MKKVIDYIGVKYDFFKEIAVKIAKDEELGQELLHSCILYVSDKYSPIKFNKALEEGYIDYLFVNVMKTECWSKTSYFYREYLRYNDRNSELIYNNENDLDATFDMETHLYNEKVLKMIKTILSELETSKKIKWWEKEVFEMYYFAEERISYRKLKVETKICESSLFNAITKVYKKVSEEVNKQLKTI